MVCAILASGAKKAVLLWSSAACGQKGKSTGRGQGACVGHPRNRVSSLPDGCAGSSHRPCAASPWGVNPHMTNPDGPVAANDANPQPPSPGPRTHTEGLTASGPWLLLSSAVGPPASCQRAGGVNDLTTARKKNKWQSCHYRPEANYTHLAQGHDVVKRTKRFAGYAGFERPLARFKDPFTSR